MDLIFCQNGGGAQHPFSDRATYPKPSLHHAWRVCRAFNFPKPRLKPTPSYTAHQSSVRLPRLPYIMPRSLFAFLGSTAPYACPDFPMLRLEAMPSYPAPRRRAAERPTIHLQPTHPEKLHPKLLNNQEIQFYINTSVLNHYKYPQRETLCNNPTVKGM